MEQLCLNYCFRSLILIIPHYLPQSFVLLDLSFSILGIFFIFYKQTTLSLSPPPQSSFILDIHTTLNNFETYFHALSPQLVSLKRNLPCVFFHQTHSSEQAHLCVYSKFILCILLYSLLTLNIQLILFVKLLPFSLNLSLNYFFFLNRLFISCLLLLMLTFFYSSIIFYSFSQKTLSYSTQQTPIHQSLHLYSSLKQKSIYFYEFFYNFYQADAKCDYIIDLDKFQSKSSKIKVEMNDFDLKQLYEIVLKKKKTNITENIYQRTQNKKSEEISSSKILPLIFYSGLFSTESAKQSLKQLQKVYLHLTYCARYLQRPKLQKIEQKKLMLPKTSKKLLFLDLDQTLIHSEEELHSKQSPSKAQNYKSQLFIRPYTLQFLNSMSKIYDIYIFTASTQEYAVPIVNLLNKDGKPIKGLLHRKHCFKTNCGFYIKDLRIIASHSLNSIILVDNTIYSFAFQINNGIPIKSFYKNSQDLTLKCLQKLLIQANKAESIPNFLQKNLQVSKILKHPLQHYTKQIINSKLTFPGHLEKL